jgi:hypothetical protein
MKLQIQKEEKTFTKKWNKHETKFNKKRKTKRKIKKNKKGKQTPKIRKINTHTIFKMKTYKIEINEWNK